MPKPPAAESPTTPARIFVAGATGATGTALFALPEAAALGNRLRPHLRPGRAAAGHPLAKHPGAWVGELGDEDALAEVLAECRTIIQLVGTMRKRFHTGDTYARSDIGTTRELIRAARRTGGIRHVVLLSSVGAGRPLGAYLRAKAEAERIVRESGLAWTIVRPSSFDGGGHRPPPGMAAALNGLAGIGFRATADRLRPIRIGDLAATILAAAQDEAPRHGRILEGRTLWEAVRATPQRPG